MRRFEFVSGSSSKFWSPEIEGQSFVVTFGRIGTAGQRKEKAFPSEAEARREMEKKIAEKLREGYVEVGAAPAAAPPPPAPEPAEKKIPELPPRLALARARRKPSAERVKAATAALGELAAVLGQRSWVVQRRLRAARRALRAIAGYDPKDNKALAAALDGLLARVGAAEGRLSLRAALGLLEQLDAGAFARALNQWGQKAPLPARQRELAGDDELALRLSLILAARPGAGYGGDAAARKEWQGLAPHLAGVLEQRGGSLAAYLAAAGVDPASSARAQALPR